MTEAALPHRGRRDNGLESEKFSPVADVDPRLADHLLDVLGLRDVPAYVEPAPATSSVVADRLFVAADQTHQARTVLTELASELGIEVAHTRDDPAGPPVDPLAGIDTDSEFAAIVAGLADIDAPSDVSVTPPAPVSRRRRRDDDEHFVPPAPPPVPRPTLASALAGAMTVLGFVIMIFGAMMGLPDTLTLPLGVVLVVAGTTVVILRLRPHPHDDNTDGDGAVV